MRREWVELRFGPVHLVFDKEGMEIYMEEFVSGDLRPVGEVPWCQLAELKGRVSKDRCRYLGA